MKEDTKRAMEIIAPMAKELSIGVKAEGDFLFCNGQAIAIGGNSAYATINEFIAYAFLRVWYKDKCFRMPQYVIEQVKRYWLTDKQVKEYMERMGLA